MPIWVQWNPELCRRFGRAHVGEFEGASALGNDVSTGIKYFDS